MSSFIQTPFSSNELGQFYQNTCICFADQSVFTALVKSNAVLHLKMNVT